MKPRQKIQSVLHKYSKIPNARPGLLGNGVGIVADPSRVGYVYVRIGNNPAISVINKTTAYVNNLSVWVGRNEIEPNIIQILGVRSIERQFEDHLDVSTQVGKHGNTHNWSDRDPVFIEGRQIMPYRPTSNGTMNVAFARGVSFLNNTWVGISGQSIDMTSYVPATGSKYGLVYFDSAGVLDVVTGTLKDINTLNIGDAPPPIPGTIPAALIRLWSGMSGVVESRIATDLADPRWTGIYFGRFVPLQNPLTSLSWTGSIRSTEAKTLVDLSYSFSAPSFLRAVEVRTTIRDSASATNDCYVVLSPNNTGGSGLVTRCSGLANNFYTNGCLIVPCNVDGDIYVECKASSSGTLTVSLQIWGYWI